MSVPDEATLSDAERSALAGLESKAEADDPRLAAHLRGHHKTRSSIRVPPVIARASLSWWGPVLAGVGLVLVVATLGSAVIVASFGAVLFVVGITMSSRLVVVRHQQGHGLLAPSPRLPDDPFVQQGGTSELDG